MAKNTYGTGLLRAAQHRETGRSPPTHGLLATVAWTVDGRTSYALEGSVFVAGAAVQWLRDGLGIIARADETRALAESVPDSGGVYFVPGLRRAGRAPLGPVRAGPAHRPHPGHDARPHRAGGARGHRLSEPGRARRHGRGVRARPSARSASTAARPRTISSASSRPTSWASMCCGPSVTETTGLGAAYLAGVGVGLWKVEDLADRWQLDRRFTPAMEPAAADGRIRGMAARRGALSRVGQACDRVRVPTTEDLDDADSSGASSSASPPRARWPARPGPRRPSRASWC